MAKHGTMTWDEIEATINVIGGADNARRLRAGELKIVEADSLKLAPSDSSAFPTFKKIALSAHDDVAELCKAMVDSSNNISDFGKGLLAEMQKESVELVCMSLRDLGLESGATTKQVYDRANRLGLDLCPAQVGLELRLAYQDQLSGEWLVVAMKPIMDRDGNPYVFSVERDDDGKRWLRTVYADPRSTWSDRNRWVFIRRQ